MERKSFLRSYAMTLILVGAILAGSLAGWLRAVAANEGYTLMRGRERRREQSLSALPADIADVVSGAYDKSPLPDEIVAGIGLTRMDQLGHHLVDLDIGGGAGIIVVEHHRQRPAATPLGHWHRARRPGSRR